MNKLQRLEAVERASARSAAVIDGEMKRGLNSLASIAVTAPFIGFFGTIPMVVGSFKGLGTEASTPFGVRMGQDLSESLVPTALGLFVAVLAFCFYQYLSARSKNFDIEMNNVSLELVDELGRL